MVKNMPTDDPHIVHLTGRVDRLDADVADIKIGVQKLLDRPVLPGFGAIASTLVSTLMVVGMIMGFAEWRLNRATYPIDTALSGLDKRVGAVDDRVWLNKIEQAVLDERSRWLESKIRVSTHDKPTQ